MNNKLINDEKYCFEYYIFYRKNVRKTNRNFLLILGWIQSRIRIHYSPGMYTFLFDPPPRAKIWPNGEKNSYFAFFLQLVKSMHIFPQIDLKFTKLKKKADNFNLRRKPPPSKKFHWGTK